MADDDDLRELHSGNFDLVNRDFRGANLSGMNLAGRDFSEAHLEKVDFTKANLSNCDFQKSKTSGLNAEGANLSKVNAEQTVIFAVNLKNTDLRESSFARAHFTRADLTGADLRGADLKNAVFKEGTTFESSVVDEKTMFDGASIFRPLSRQNAFRFYRVERGILVRKTQDQLSDSDVQVSEDVTCIEIENKIDRVLNSLNGLADSTVKTASSSLGIGHNNPPTETPINREELDELAINLREVQMETSKQEPDKKIIKKVAAFLHGGVKKILNWSWRKIELAADEFAKEIGKKTASVALVVSAWLALSSLIGDLSDLLFEFATMK
ncbi:MAG: pentapeptide repeat-containing protein [Roseibium sp.]|uniref:pentapeptide repeat-containing protein n=1 Tax=Roseibium sp. TaxID=1936156 RepID=UPI00263255E9|nr:pentapeptide repeat-containing protein [Roseibium sp.]MCV0424148.1 pentapeptide repeat-containing protein [Roseibium sp.]